MGKALAKIDSVFSSGELNQDLDLISGVQKILVPVIVPDIKPEFHFNRTPHQPQTQGIVTTNIILHLVF